MRNPDTHSPEEVQVGIDRFFADFRASLGTDAEPEVAEPPMCVECGVLPAAFRERCFGCNAKPGRLPA